MKRRLVSLLLKAALCMMIIPLITVTAGAATQYVATAAELQTALSSSGKTEVVLLRNITGHLTPGLLNGVSIQIQGEKTLDLNGHNIDLTADKADIATMFLVKKNVVFTLKDSTNSGAYIT